MKETLVPVSTENFNASIAFLQPREYRCITLMSHVVDKGIPCLPGKNVKKMVCLLRDATKPHMEQNIDGILLCTSSGIVFHCLRENTDLRPYEVLLKKSMSPQSVRCIIGKKEDNQFLESLLSAPPSPAVDYQLMTLEILPSEEQCALPAMHTTRFDGQYTLIRGTPLDAPKILSLQEKYEIEEVVPPGGPFDRKACLANLTLALEKQHINIIKVGEQCIAKAGTNARGLAWDQIGGVFTEQRWRGHGIASALVAFTARERMMDNQKVALFVKLTNEFAIKAYKKAGFTPQCLFRIAYYP